MVTPQQHLKQHLLSYNDVTKEKLLGFLFFPQQYSQLAGG